jgi:hypothetical protein
VNCPNCGHALSAVTLPFTAPWKCHCLGPIGWWNATLTTEAAAAWRPHYRDWGALTSTVLVAIAAEQYP